MTIKTKTDAESAYLQTMTDSAYLQTMTDSRAYWKGLYQTAREDVLRLESELRTARAQIHALNLAAFHKAASLNE